MKITKVTGIPLRCKIDTISDALTLMHARQAMLVKVETDCGLYGIGEAFTYGAPLAAMKILVEQEFGAMLIGKDPTKIEDLWQTMYWRSIAHGRRGIILGAISGIDIALWDLLGKATHMPVAKLLGQRYDRIQAYASGGFYSPGKDIDRLKREMEGYMKKGYRDVKMKVGRNLDRQTDKLHYMENQQDAVTVEEDYRRVEAVRSVLGDGRLMVDSNASYDTEMAVERGMEFARLGVNYMEEPLPFENIKGFKRLRETVPEIKVIGCETQQGIANFGMMLKEGALDVVQPDLAWAGGITEVRKIGALAESMNHKISLHCFGSAVVFAASLHISAAMANTDMIECEENKNPLHDELTKTPLETDEHMNFIVPEGDGLGIELDWDKVEELTVR